MEKKVKKGRGLRVFIALGVMCMLLMGPVSYTHLTLPTIA